jgi:hypothetical protein
MWPGVRRVFLEMDSKQRSALQGLSNVEKGGQLWMIMILMEQWVTGGKMGKEGSVEVIWGRDWPTRT